MADFSPSISQERERLKIELAQGELKAQLRGQGLAPAFGAGLYCPTEARERHQQRLATIKALCASVTALAQEV